MRTIMKTKSFLQFTNKKQTKANW